MSLRISSVALLLFAAACREPSADTPGSVDTIANRSDAVSDDRIECAVSGATTFARVCAVDRAGVDLTIRHPDGGFRKLRMTPDGIAAADGAEPATLATVGDTIEVSVGGDRYRLPAALRDAK